ncbi:hypothetical protein [Candidatus Albibeggiatoa sp. nov. NOAA]|uniref:hypothetical protein n=1 Tax=Candidatus Albibeggiatoa sp. nov. NOAA TaxID=3162724 RepID=UPI0032F1B8AC|nr:hypothetical protein [Thiotrichaceae bacterium]
MALVAFHYFPEFEIVKYTLLGLSFALLVATAGSSMFNKSDQSSIQDSDLADLTDLHDLTVHDLHDLTDLDLDLIDLEKK